jgi:hypothetical protein
MAGMIPGAICRMMTSLLSFLTLRDVAISLWAIASSISGDARKRDIILFARYISSIGGSLRLM